MKIALLGTGVGQAHAGVFAARDDIEVVVFGRSADKLAVFAEQFSFPTTTDLDALFDDPSIDLIDVCLPTALHPEMVHRALAANKHVLTELPLAPDLKSARAVADAAARSDRQVFVDMYDRFMPAHRILLDAVADSRYGQLRQLSIEQSTALLWPGFRLGVDVIATAMMHGDLDVIIQALGAPDALHVTSTMSGADKSSVEAVLNYPKAIARCSGSSLMPMSYGSRGGFRATFDDGVLDSVFGQGLDGKPDAVVTVYTAAGSEVIDLPASDPYTAMIEHVLAVLRGEAENTIGPETVLATLDSTLRIQAAATG